MTGAQVVSLVTGLPAVITAVTGLIVALRAHRKISAHQTGHAVLDSQPAQPGPAARP